MVKTLIKSSIETHSQPLPIIIMASISVPLLSTALQFVPISTHPPPPLTCPTPWSHPGVEGLIGTNEKPELRADRSSAHYHFVCCISIQHPTPTTTINGSPDIAPNWKHVLPPPPPPERGGGVTRHMTGYAPVSKKVSKGCFFSHTASTFSFKERCFFFIAL